jgi:23S rRNA A1618 N6-methylase RlmF
MLFIFCRDGFYIALANGSSLDFTMCNPPFYESQEEMITSAKTKERPAFSVSTTLTTQLAIYQKDL